MLEAATRRPRKRAAWKCSPERSAEKVDRHARKREAGVAKAIEQISQSLRFGIPISRSEAMTKFGHHAYAALVELVRTGQAIEQRSGPKAVYSLANPDDAPEEDDSDDTIVAPDDDWTGSAKFYMWDLPTADEILDRFYQRGVQYAARVREMNDTVPLAA